MTSHGQPAGYAPAPYGPVARPGLVPAILLAVAGVLTIVSSFLTIAQTTDRLVNPNAQFGDDPHAHVNITTNTAWSTTFSAGVGRSGQPLDGWGLVIVGALAVLVAALLLAGRWSRRLATLVSGLLVGVVLMSVLRFAELMSWDFRDKNEALHTSAGPAVWLQIPAGVLAIVVALIAMSAPRVHQPPGLPPRTY